MAGRNPNRVKTSDFKNRVLNLAQTSVYQVSFQPPPAVQSFLISINSDLNYSDVGGDIELQCDATALPGASLATHEVRNDYAGVTEKMVYRKQFDSDELNLSFYVDKRYKVIRFFDGWMDYITGFGGNGSRYARVNGYRMNYPKFYKTNIFLTKFEKNTGDAALFYTFVDAFPISIVKSPVSYGPSDVLKYNVTFSYVRYVLDRVTSNYAD